MTGTGIKAKLAAFGRDRRGAIAPIFALVAIPLVLAAGVGIDVSRVVSARNNLQDALDAAALAVGRLPSNTPIATMKQTAQYWVTANLSDKNLPSVTPQVVVDTAAGQIDLSASVVIPSAVVGLMGVQSLPVKGHATIKYGTSHVELALVLDNTGSMSQDNKLQSLKDASNQLVDTLAASAAQSSDPDVLKIGVVPFSTTVNIGASNRGQTWLTGVSPYSSDIFTTAGVDRFLLLDKMKISWGGCVESRPMPYDIQDTAPSLATPATLFTPFFWPDEPDDKYKSNTYYDAYANNYLPDLAVDKTWQTKQGDALKYLPNKAVSGTSAWTGYNLGPNASCQMAPLSRLTKDTASIKTKLKQMIAVGDTEIPIGLMWGWHVLSPNLPFADGAAYGTKGVIKIVVLVTDGQNTYSSGYNSQVSATDNSLYTALGYQWQNRISTDGGSYSNPSQALNDRMAKVCSNMKAAGVVIYTVPVEVTDTTIKGLLQACATSPDKFIDVASSSDLAAAFANIAGSITALRIAG